MGILGWIVLGLLAGFIAQKLMPGEDTGSGSLVLTCVLGIVGAFVGGFVGSLLDLGDVNTFDVRSLALAVVGAVIVIFAYRKLK